MTKRNLGGRLIATAVLGGITALGTVTSASADVTNPVNRMAEQTNPAVQQVEVAYTAKISFQQSFLTDDGWRLFFKAKKMFSSFQLGSWSEVAQNMFDQIEANPTKYLKPEKNAKVESTTVTDYYGGSSFTATPDGYIVTARHVVTPDTEVNDSFAQSGVAWASKIDTAGWNAFLNYEGWHLNNDAKRSIAGAVTAYQRATLKVSVGAPKVSVLLPIASADGAPDAKLVPADVVYRSGTATGEDVAVLRVHVTGQMPALALAANSAQQGDTMYLDAFPALPNDSKAAYLTPTVTSGQITAIKPNSGGLQELQTNATASAGSSGAAAVNEQGNVIGIEVAGAVVDGVVPLGENYLMPIGTIHDALVRAGANPAAGPTTELYDQALADFHADHYSKALAEFNQVKDLYIAHPYVSDFISKSNLAISQGKDVPVVAPEPAQTTPWALIAAAAVVVIGLIIGALVFLRSRQAKSGSGPDGTARAGDGDLPTAPASPGEPYTTVDPMAGFMVDPAGSGMAESAAAGSPEQLDMAPVAVATAGSEDGAGPSPDPIPDWEPIDYVAGFPEADNRQNS